MIPHEHIRAKYQRSAEREFRRVLNAYLADYMTRTQNAATFGDLITAAEFEPDEAILREAIVKVYVKVGARFAKMAINDLQQQKAQMLGGLYKSGTIEIDYWEEFFRMFAQTKTGAKLKWITNTTKEIFQSTVSRITDTAGKEGWSINRTMKAIQDQIGFSNRYRAERIARTEIMTASNYAILEGGKQSGIPSRKEWLPIIDDRSRDDHAAMSGYGAIEMDEDFIVGGVAMGQPGDDRGGAEHVINCRCALGLVPALTYEDIINQ